MGRGCDFKVPGTTVGLLSAPSKMPCYSFSIPAGSSCPFKVVTPDPETGAQAICAICYAMMRNYLRHNVTNAQAVRFQWTLDSMRDAASRQAWIDTMVSAIKGTTTMAVPYFRIHDSGDFFSPQYVMCWVEVIRALPQIKFWAPTRSYRATSPKWIAAFAELNALPNVTVRPSALHFDAPSPMLPMYAAGSSASATGYNCPAHEQQNMCLDCRLCWDSPSTPIVYRKH